MTVWTLRCGECGHKFKSQVASPKKCPSCKASFDPDDDETICMPFVRSTSSIGKVGDDLYRQMEAGSAHRAEVAAEMTGAPVSEMSSLKITDLGSSRHQGEVAAVLPNNPVTQAMEAAAARGQPMGFGDGLGYSAAVAQGPGANAGAKFQNVLRERHGAATGGSGVSDRPALETLQPGYRRRA